MLGLNRATDLGSATKASDEPPVPANVSPARPTGTVAAPVRSRPGHDWQTERARILHRICKGIARRIEAGQTLTKSVRWFSWYHRRRQYRMAPRKRRRLSRGTLVRLWYRWKANPSPGAFKLNFKSGLPPIPSALIREFLSRCAAPGVLHARTVADGLLRDWTRGDFVRGLGPLRQWLKENRKRTGPAGRRLRFPFSASSLYGRLSREEREQCQALFAARRAVIARQRRCAMVERRFAQFVKLARHKT